MSNPKEKVSDFEFISNDKNKLMKARNDLVDEYHRLVKECNSIVIVQAKKVKKKAVCR